MRGSRGAALEEKVLPAWRPQLEYSGLVCPAAPGRSRVSREPCGRPPGPYLLRGQPAELEIYGDTGPALLAAGVRQSANPRWLQRTRPASPRPEASIATQDIVACSVAPSCELDECQYDRTRVVARGNHELHWVPLSFRAENVL